MLKPLIIKPLWGGGSDYVEPHVVLISETNSMAYKNITPPQPKIVNYVTYYESGKKFYIQTDYPVTSELYVYHAYSGDYGILKLSIGEQSYSNVVAPPLNYNQIRGIGFTQKDSDFGQQECEDDTYIYRIKNN